MPETCPVPIRPVSRRALSVLGLAALHLGTLVYVSMVLDLLSPASRLLKGRYYRTEELAPIAVFVLAAILGVAVSLPRFRLRVPPWLHLVAPLLLAVFGFVSPIMDPNWSVLTLNIEAGHALEYLWEFNNTVVKSGNAAAAMLIPPAALLIGDLWRNREQPRSSNVASLATLLVLGLLPVLSVQEVSISAARATVVVTLLLVVATGFTPAPTPADPLGRSGQELALRAIGLILFGAALVVTVERAGAVFQRGHYEIPLGLLEPIVLCLVAIAIAIATATVATSEAWRWRRGVPLRQLASALIPMIVLLVAAGISQPSTWRARHLVSARAAPAIEWSYSVPRVSKPYGNNVPSPDDVIVLADGLATVSTKRLALVESELRRAVGGILASRAARAPRPVLSYAAGNPRDTFVVASRNTPMSDLLEVARVATELRIDWLYLGVANEWFATSIRLPWILAAFEPVPTYPLTWIGFRLRSEGGQNVEQPASYSIPNGDGISRCVLEKIEDPTSYFEVDVASGASTAESIVRAESALRQLQRCRRPGETHEAGFRPVLRVESSVTVGQLVAVVDALEREDWHMLNPVILLPPPSCRRELWDEQECRAPRPERSPLLRSGAYAPKARSR